MAAEPAPIPTAPMGPSNKKPTTPPIKPLRLVTFFRCFFSRDRSSSPVIVIVFVFVFVIVFVCPKRGHLVLARSFSSGVTQPRTASVSKLTLLLLLLVLLLLVLVVIECVGTKRLILARSFSGVTKLCTDGVSKLSLLLGLVVSQGSASICISSKLLPSSGSWLIVVTVWATGRSWHSSAEPTHVAMGSIIVAFLSKKCSSISLLRLLLR